MSQSHKRGLAACLSFILLYGYGVTAHADPDTLKDTSRQ